METRKAKTCFGRFFRETAAAVVAKFRFQVSQLPAQSNSELYRTGQIAGARRVYARYIYTLYYVYINTSTIRAYIPIPIYNIYSYTRVHTIPRTYNFTRYRVAGSGDDILISFIFDSNRRDATRRDGHKMRYSRRCTLIYASIYV